MKSIRCRLGFHQVEPINESMGAPGGMMCGRDGCMQVLSQPLRFTSDKAHPPCTLPTCDRCGNKSIVHGFAVSLGTVEGVHIVDVCDKCAVQMRTMTK